MKYLIIDTYGAPQCGAETIVFDSWDELQDYVSETEGVEERISEGYAVIVEAD